MRVFWVLWSSAIGLLGYCYVLSEDPHIFSFPVDILDQGTNKVVTIPFSFRIGDDLDNVVNKFCDVNHLNTKNCAKLNLLTKKHYSDYMFNTKVRQVAIIIGTRPDVIKLGLLIPMLEKWQTHVNVTLINTGQHKEMLEPLINVFDLKIKYNLELMEFSKSGLAAFTSACITRLDKIFRSLNLDLVIIQGDTSSAYAAAIAAFYLKIPIAHVEAGLRTYDLKQPFPEEMHRRYIDMVSTMHFVPTMQSKSYLVNENVNFHLNNQIIKVVGNTVIDTANHILKQRLTDTQLQTLNGLPIDLSGPKHIIITTHRRENFGDSIEKITMAVKQLAHSHPHRKFVYFIHKNPSVYNVVSQRLQGVHNVALVEPLDYPCFLRVLVTSALVLTDSGGIQEEAAFLGVPCFVLRDITERSEGQALGLSTLLPIDVPTIVRETSLVLHQDNSKKPASATPVKSSKVYGDGNAIVRIGCFIIQYFQLDLYTGCPKEALSEWIFEYPAPKVPRHFASLPSASVGDQQSENNHDAVLQALSEYQIGESSSNYFRPHPLPKSINIIITQYKRNTTEKQIAAILQQTCISNIHRIVIYQNEDHVNLDAFLPLWIQRMKLKYLQIFNGQKRQTKKASNTKNSEKKNELKGSSNNGVGSQPHVSSSDSAWSTVDYSSYTTSSQPSTSDPSGSPSDRPFYFPNIEIIHSKNHNYKFHGRFTLPLLFDSEYTVIFDDDTIPQPQWVEYAIAKCDEHTAIVGAVGMVIGPNKQYFFTAPLEFDLEVDYVGHSWVFRTEWARHLWSYHVPTWECCEDIGFSAAAWLRLYDLREL